jgi:precorrin-6A/cobalt-precorrin-6A reductase
MAEEARAAALPSPRPSPASGRGRRLRCSAAARRRTVRAREREWPAQREGEGPWPAPCGARKRLLILGGTSEAAELARRAAAEFGDRLDVTTSLVGRLTSRPDLPGRIRIGGFGGASGLARYLQTERIDLLIDATHPFAVVISRNAAEACAALGVPRLMLVRQAWEAGPSERWLEAGSLEEAAALLPGIARRVFLTTGPGGIQAFAAASGVWFLVRLFTPAAAPLPLPDYETIVARPPFTRDGERELMLRHRIDTLVTKNSGGPTEAKLAGARDASVRVLMIRRPPLPAGYRGETAGNVEGALAWVGRHL